MKNGMYVVTVALFVGSGLWGCGDDDGATCVDSDGDGFQDSSCGGSDCNDQDDSVHPEAEEICGDGIDQDCSGADLACGCDDLDGDSYGDLSCGGSDCNDQDDSIHPEAEEICGDGIDQDCSGADLPCPNESACADLAAGAQVILNPGDDLQDANDIAPAGTTFLLNSGVYANGRISDPKDGNVFVGQDGATLDGGSSLTEAFDGSATDVTVCNLVLRNYADNGVHFNAGSGVRIESVEVYDTGSGSGETNGAIRFDNMSDLTVLHCYFERVSSGVLPTSCSGPITIEHNHGLNTGRNFVQLAHVSGGGIRVRYNSMDRDGTYVATGNDDVEDWISVYDVDGLPADPVEVSYNRARGHGPSSSGSFIMLGDGGGSHQEAVGNVGVTPGQVGIGLSGGHFIEVRDNLMFSESWPSSNIAFYSADYGSGGCGDHVIANNRANWINSANQQNDFWASGSCDYLETGNQFPDSSLDASIWDDWSY